LGKKHQSTGEKTPHSGEKNTTQWGKNALTLLRYQIGEKTHWGKNALGKKYTIPDFSYKELFSRSSRNATSRITTLVVDEGDSRSCLPAQD
jgi:hypothetical protein